MTAGSKPGTPWLAYRRTFRGYRIDRMKDLALLDFQH
jgi:hypothetical protein